MFSIDLQLGAVLYALLGVLGIAGLWFYYDRRDRRLYDRTRRKTTFHCLKCDRVYTSTERHAVCPCPQCGHENARLRF